MSSRIKGIIDAVSDLAMDYSSRMARAKDQGFDTDTPVYHGTASDFDAFDPDRAIGSQFWSTTDRAAIESGDVGAQGKGVVKEMYQRINNPAGWNEYDQRLRPDHPEKVSLTESQADRGRGRASSTLQARR